MRLNVQMAKPEDYPELWRLFHDTVHHVNRRDYTPQQLEAWAPEKVDLSHWSLRLEGINPFVVTIEGKIVGFSDVQADGLVDMFYVHHAWQRKGIGSRLFTEIHHKAEQMKLAELHSHVSMTARPFFEVHGFHAVTPQQVTINGVTLKNFLMRKTLSV
ncbi:GNAT family N-acetyltransferase [Bremerella alba]|uniref:Putative N-acetyltransferase YafP n=1 Tax=Bremerella alba TaxID=980252 RepID=A0A7V8V3S7_9BACT|nr:GNAT family N-acetyltransferase [Bremerella alba]MBA2114403.1 putative N-acetyltransferase YafP [Bremerella alba]